MSGFIENKTIKDENVVYSGRTLKFYKCTFKNIKYTDSILNNFEFISCKFDGVTFDNCDLTNVVIREHIEGVNSLTELYDYYTNPEIIIQGSKRSNINNLCIKNCKMPNTTMVGIDLKNSKFIKNSDMKKTNLAYVNIQNVKFEECYMPDCYFTESSIEHAIFNDCYIDNSDFSGSEISNTEFKKCMMTYVNMDFTTLEINIEFNECDLGHSSFVRTNIEGVKFTRCDLSGVDMFGALNFKLSNFIDSDLTGIITTEFLYDGNIYPIPEEDCSLCLEPGVDFETNCNLGGDVKHYFHKKCLKEYLNATEGKTHNCPLCRKPNAFFGYKKTSKKKSKRRLQSKQ